MADPEQRDRAWAEINLDHIAHNVREIRRITGRRTDIMAIVKADAYGHGVMETVRTILENGISRLGVSILDEAIQLRKAGIDVPILVLGHTTPARAGEIIDYHVNQTIFSHDIAQALSEAGCARKTKVRVHVKIDTGMTRLGFMPGYSAVKAVSDLGRLPGLVIEGLYTHFATADEADSTYLDRQFETFMGIWHELNRIGLYIPLKHCANSAALLRFPRTHLDIVRPGIALYGLYPWGNAVMDTFTPVTLKPAMTLKTTVAMVKDAGPGTPVGYGRKYITAGPSRIAVISIGYADGFVRNLGNRARVLAGGGMAPVVGAVCMDQCMVDVTDMPEEVQSGDEIIVMGCRNGLCIPAEEIADWSGTIHYEVVSLVGRRVPRVYTRDGRIVQVIKYLL